MTKQVRQSRNVFDIETARPTGADLERLRAMALVRFSDETMDDLMKDLNQDFRTRKQSIKSHKTYKDATKNEKIDALKSEYREKKEVIEATDLDKHNAKRLEDRRGYRMHMCESNLPQWQSQEIRSGNDGRTS